MNFLSIVPKDSGKLANVSFFCFDGTFEMDSPQNECEAFRQRRGLETGILGRKKIMRGHRGGEWILSRKERMLQFCYLEVKRWTWKGK